MLACLRLRKFADDNARPSNQVKASMSRLKAVVGERKREHKAQLSALGLERKPKPYNPLLHFQKGFRNGEWKKGIKGRHAKYGGRTYQQFRVVQRRKAMR